MDQYVVKHNVPILDEHDLVDDEGRVLVNLDDSFLQRVARNNNQRIKETGDETPIIVGHTKDGLPERHQPEIVGWASNFRVRRLFKTGRKAIFATMRFLKDKIQVVKQLPRRSVELWLKKMVIDPISLLGSTTPERDLGLLRFSKDNQTYSPVFPSEDQMDNDKNALVQAVLAALKETDVWKFVESQMNDAGGDDLGGDIGGMDDMPPVDDEMALEGDEDMDLGGDDDVPLDDDEDEDPKKQYSASGTNTGIPMLDRVKMQRDSLKIRLARVEAAEKQKDKVIKDLQLKFQRAERDKDLLQLESEGYLFDRAEELEDLVGVPEKQYKKRLQMIKKRYQKAPVGELGIYTADRSERSSVSKDKMARVVALASEKGISYPEALKQVEGERVS